MKEGNFLGICGTAIGGSGRAALDSIAAIVGEPVPVEE
ncbi:MAG: hypothetical protein JWQ20_220 [Conexibacter sp.]|nr:hypothetical protein [Conexibacter sp.]